MTSASNAASNSTVLVPYDPILPHKTPLSELLDEDALDVPLQPPYLEQKPDQQSLKSLKEHSAEITVEHLLSHTAGFTERPGSEKDGITSGESWDHGQIGKDSYSKSTWKWLLADDGE